MDFVEKITDDAKLQEIRQRWTKEQYEIAAQVDFPKDNWDIDNDKRLIGETDDFRLVSLVDNGPEAERGTSTTVNNENYYYFGGVDVSFPSEASDPSVAVYVVVDARTLHVVYQDFEYFTLQVPYIPTFLAFREIEPLQRLIVTQQRTHPQWTPRAILVDGNGVWHPRRAGIACFVGIRTGIPTIGIGKTLLYEGGLTRERVAAGIQESLARAQKALQNSGSGDTLFLKDDGNGQNSTVNPSNERVLFDKYAMGQSDCSIIPSKGEGINCDRMDRRSLVQALAPYCRGLAIPMVVPDDNQADNANESNETGVDANTQTSSHVLAYALVGHGGRTLGTAQRTPKGGTINPIFVSVGHGLSARQAVEMTAALCVSKIPEPVRQADLIGRDLLRQRRASSVTSESVIAENNPL